MKKWFAILLLLIAATTAFYPCCSKDNCCNDALTSKSTDQSNHRSEGNCSPFITCSTCPGFTGLATRIEIPLVQQEKPVHHSRAISSPLSSYIASLLQPPQIA